MPSPPGMEWGMSQTEEKEWGIGDTDLEVVGEAGIAAAGLGAWIARRAEGMVRRGGVGVGERPCCAGIATSRREARASRRRGGGWTPFLTRGWRAGAGGLLS